VCQSRGRQRAILAYEISWFLFDFPRDFPQKDVICCKVGGAGGLGWFPSLISRKSALISHDFNLISTDFSTRCTRFHSLPTPRYRQKCDTIRVHTLVPTNTNMTNPPSTLAHILHSSSLKQGNSSCLCCYLQWPCLESCSFISIRLVFRQSHLRLSDHFNTSMCCSSIAHSKLCLFGMYCWPSLAADFSVLSLTGSTASLSHCGEVCLLKGSICMLNVLTTIGGGYYQEMQVEWHWSASLLHLNQQLWHSLEKDTWQAYSGKSGVCFSCSFHVYKYRAHKRGWLSSGYVLKHHMLIRG